jgi:hypothetical protein
VRKDPHEINNLAKDPAYAGVLRKLRGELDAWMETTGDHGRVPESAAMYQSDMAVYLERLQSRDPAHAKIIASNIGLMQQWAAEGK